MEDQASGVQATSRLPNTGGWRLPKALEWPGLGASQDRQALQNVPRTQVADLNCAILKGETW